MRGFDYHLQLNLFLLYIYNKFGHQTCGVVFFFLNNSFL